MEAQPARPSEHLTSALDEMLRLVQENSTFTLHQLAEAAVRQWIRVVEIKESVQLRYPAPRGGAEEFFLGVERGPAISLDLSVCVGSIADFPQALEERLRRVEERIAAYFARSGYRSSTEQCDQMMVDLSLVSRFLSAWSLRALEELGEAARPETGQAHTPCWHHYLWEPYLNDGIVAWEQNSLQPFESALGRLGRALGMPPPERPALFHGAGYPLRSRGRPRIKVSIQSSDARPLRGKSFFELRLSQLRHRLAELVQPPGELLDGLRGDVVHFCGMIRENKFLLAAAPWFLANPRAGLPVIRRNPAVHPFLLDAPGFLKQAVLFANGTYGRTGDGLNAMYLQVRQLRRYCHFNPGGEARDVANLIDECVIEWEENRWQGFTSKLVDMANRMRTLTAEQA